MNQNRTICVPRKHLLPDPYFSEEFKIHANASYFQLGAVTIHNGKTIALYSKI